MEVYQIQGGVRLSGEVTLSGAKNAILPILAATVAIKGVTVIRGCPDLSDVRIMMKILEELGCRVHLDQGVITVDATTIHRDLIPEMLSREMRSSMFLMGPMLARCGSVVLSYPGGCEIGLRPIDIHLKALRSLGVDIKETNACLECTAAKMKGSEIQLDFPSVGATENVIMAATGAEGETRIYNAAKEPEIQDLARFLNSAGARIRGAGTGSITIQGKRQLHGIEHKVISDRIEAGTFLTAIAITGGEGSVRNVEPGNLGMVLSKLREAGCKVREEKGLIHIKGPSRLTRLERITTMPYPGFPTDLQSQFLSLVSIAKGTSIIRETIFENRFKQADELIRMGAKIQLFDQTAIVSGVEQLTGTRVKARDLRGGAALVIAGLAADGETTIENICYVDRGYDKFETGLSNLGARIRRVSE